MRVMKHGTEATQLCWGGQTIDPDEDGAFTVPIELGEHLLRFGWTHAGALPEKTVTTGFAPAKPRASRAKKPATADTETEVE